jgi:hypothetical protein
MSLTEFLNEFHFARTEKNADHLIQLFKMLDGTHLPASLLVCKAMAIQLAGHDHYSLKDAEACLIEAIAQDEYCLNAYLELACFQYAVNDNPADAVVSFDRGIAQAKKVVDEMQMGKAKALIELGRFHEAQQALSGVDASQWPEVELIKSELP